VLQARLHKPSFTAQRLTLKLETSSKLDLTQTTDKITRQNIFTVTATLDAAIWGAELALGEGRQRIYLVEPTGSIEDDPNLTDKKFPGNPTMSYRSRYPFKVVGEITIWHGHPPEQLEAMKNGLAKIKEQGIEAINTDITELVNNNSPLTSLADAQRTG
jgi:rifampin ADP-ribosylating transferase